MLEESVVVEKVPNDCCREVLEKEKCWRRCCRDALGGIVGEKCWGA